MLKNFKDQPKPFRISFIFFIVFMFCLISTLPLARWVGSFYVGFDGLGPAFMTLLIGLGSSLLSGMISIITGLSVVSRRKEVLYWVLIEMVLIVGVFFLWPYYTV